MNARSVLPLTKACVAAYEEEYVLELSGIACSKHTEQVVGSFDEIHHYYLHAVIFQS